MNTELWLGLGTGVLFGLLLQKGRVLRFEKQLGALLLKDMTIFKFMLSAILVGMLGINLLAEFGGVALSHKPMNLGAILLGGALFGGGWALMGYCPGTSVGAVGEGRWHALFAILGMLLGAALYAELYPLLLTSVLAWQDFGKIGWAETLGIPTWLLILLFAVGILLLFRWFERKGL